MGPLEGIRILDFSRLAPGPYGGMLLADMGADVVRIDRAPFADQLLPEYGDVLGRGKRSVALNLKDPAGVAVALRLIDSADVLLEGFRPGVMERLGLGPDVVRDRNPRCVYARLTGWGQEGPLSQRAGHDINYIAISGVLSAVGREGQPPVPPVNLLGDFAGGGLLCAFGILCALVERQTSGRGQVVDSAMLDGAANLFSFFAAAIHSGSWGPHGTNMLDSGAHFYDVYECADGRYVSVGALEPRFYAELITGLGLDADELPYGQHDPQGNEAMRDILAEAFSSKTRDEWAAVFEDRDACVYPVLDLKEAAGHRHNEARGVYVQGPFDVVQPAPAPRLDRTPAQIGGPAPEPGEHTRELLSEAGYTPGEIARLGSDGSVAWP